MSRYAKSHDPPHHGGHESTLQARLAAVEGLRSGPVSAVSATSAYPDHAQKHVQQLVLQHVGCTYLKKPPGRTAVMTARLMTKADARSMRTSRSPYACGLLLCPADADPDDFYSIPVPDRRRRRD